jgi:hypothetical protein
MPKLRQFLRRLRVTVNEDKTRIVDAKDGFDFLGVHFRRQPSRRDGGKWFCYCWPSQKSMQRIRDKVKAAIGRDNRPPLQEILDRLNPVLRGWSAYSAGSTQPSTFGRWISTSRGNYDVGCRITISADGERSGERRWPTGERLACAQHRAVLCT